MSEAIEALLADDPQKWVTDLPAYQRDSITELLDKGIPFDEVAQRWLTASASNTFRFGAVTAAGDKSTFLSNVKAEVRAYLCGDKRYAKERAGLFGEKAPARTMVTSSMAVAIAPHIGVAAAVLAPIIALVLASLGAIALNAWCASTSPKVPPATDS